MSKYSISTDLEKLIAIIKQKPRLLMMLDYDGTLVPIQAKPDLARPSGELLDLLNKLAFCEGIRLAIISGRDLLDLKGLLPVESIYLVGGHGAAIEGPDERRYDIINPGKLQPVLEQLVLIAKQCVGKASGFIIETKTTSLALHYRLADPARVRPVLTAFVTKSFPWLKPYALELLHGKKVIEVRSRLINKGKAVEYLLGLSPGYYPVFLGDDRTDEDAFAVLQGKGIGVLIAPEDRTTRAALRLESPEKVQKLLRYLFKTHCEVLKSGTSF